MKPDDIEFRLWFEAKTFNGKYYIKGFITEEAYLKAIEAKCLEEMIERKRRLMENQLREALEKE